MAYLQVMIINTYLALQFLILVHNLSLYNIQGIFVILHGMQKLCEYYGYCITKTTLVT